MWFSVSEQFAVTLYSFFVGILLGVIYDFFKISRVVLGIGASSHNKISQKLYNVNLPFVHKKTLKKNKEASDLLAFLLIFAGDVLYFLVCSAVYSLFLHHAICGNVRWYFLLSSGIGFLLYYLSVSKLVLSVIDIIYALCRVLLAFIIQIVMIPFRFVCGIAIRLFNVLKLKILYPIRENAVYNRYKRYTELRLQKLKSELQIQNV